MLFYYRLYSKRSWLRYSKRLLRDGIKRTDTMTTLAIISLFVPLAIELWNDRNGETAEEKVNDAIWRVVLAVVAGIVNFYMLNKPIFDAMFLALAIHWLLFDYLINIILYKNNVIDYANWFSYTGKTGFIDDISLWKRIGPWGRFTVKTVVFITALVIFIV